MTKKILALACCAIMAMGAVAQDASDISKLALGIQAGVGYMTTTGTLHNNFGGGATFNAGLTADYTRLRLKADVAYSQPNLRCNNMWGIKDDKNRDAQINSNSNATQIMTALQLGYKIYDGKRFSITPAAGMFMNHTSWGLSDIEWDKDKDGKEYFVVKNNHDFKYTNVSWMASIDIDIKFHERTTLEPFFLNNRYSRLTSYIRITPWIAGGKFNKVSPELKGMYTGVTIRYAGFMRSLGF